MSKKKESPKEKIEKKQQDKPLKKERDYDSLWDSYLRLQADFDNYKKRSLQVRSEFIKFANESLILELLGILDDFERGIKSAEQKKDYDLLHQGVDMISKQLHSLLEGKGLQRVKVIGEKFDPHLHEAMEVIDGESDQENTVVEELQAGYTLNGRVLRTAKVKVLKSKKEEEESEEQEEEK